MLRCIGNHFFVSVKHPCAFISSPLSFVLSGKVCLLELEKGVEKFSRFSNWCLYHWKFRMPLGYRLHCGLFLRLKCALRKVAGCLRHSVLASNSSLNSGEAAWRTSGPTTERVVPRSLSAASHPTLCLPSYSLFLQRSQPHVFPASARTLERCLGCWVVGNSSDP